MFNNIGGKIKDFSVLVTWIGIIASIIVGVIFISNDNSLTGILIIVLGSIASWLSSWLLYGYGELIENSSIIVKNSYKTGSSNENLSTILKKARELKKLYSQGKLTAEEYNDALENLGILFEEN